MLVRPRAVGHLRFVTSFSVIGAGHKTKGSEPGLVTTLTHKNAELLSDIMFLSVPELKAEDNNLWIRAGAFASIVS